MINSIKSLTVIVMLFAAFAGSVFATPTTSTFTATNNTTANLGTVTVNCSSGHQFYVSVPGQGNYTTSIDSNPVSVTINGQSVPQGGSVRVTLSDGTSVRATLTGIIVVTDQQEGK
jgi:hypothetical protein